MGIVLHYMLRLEPFTSLYLNFQGGKFDHADRLFQSIESAYINSLSNTSDVKELIPEFFYMPEFLENSNSYHLGVKQDGEPIGDVALPPWAKDDNSSDEFDKDSIESDDRSLEELSWETLELLVVEAIAPAVIGTTNVLKACYEAKVKRVVVVSSCGAVYANPIYPKGKVFDEDCWSYEDYCRKKEDWYLVSKTLSEREALAFAAKTGLDVVTVCPSLVFGPLMQPTVNLSSEMILKYFKADLETVENVLSNMVDIRDVADALLLTYEKPEASGRYICSSHAIKISDMINILKTMYPSYPYPKRCFQIMFPSTLQGTGENWTMMKTICVTEYLNYEGDYMPLQPLEDENDTVISFLYPLEPPIVIYIDSLMGTVKQGRTRRGRFQSRSGQLLFILFMMGTVLAKSSKMVPD
ncbi:BEACH domain-containing protein B [Zea mays]|uniref:BEACH domain-containing protein B n=1 Tax=Zea mays TaxID=4577 RepID=A0A3L6FXY5_MAIZE|nr:BEACH domain-containing protein B [Zea mays]